jgi:hypothetical protein
VTNRRRRRRKLEGSGLGRRLHLARANKPRKDAYGILLAVLRSVNEPEAAIASFHAEANADNRGFKRARETLRQHILNSRQSGSLRSAGMRPSPKSSGLLLDRAAVTRAGTYTIPMAKVTGAKTELASLTAVEMVSDLGSRAGPSGSGGCSRTSSSTVFACWYWINQ